MLVVGRAVPVFDVWSGPPRFAREHLVDRLVPDLRQRPALFNHQQLAPLVGVPVRPSPGGEAELDGAEVLIVTPGGGAAHEVALPRGDRFAEGEHRGNDRNGRRGQKESRTGAK